MQLRIEDAPEFGEGILKLTINGLLVSAFCPGSDAHNNVLAVTKSKKKNLAVSILKCTAEPGDLNMWFKNERGSKCVPIKLPNDVFSLNINGLPINIFRKESYVLEKGKKVMKQTPVYLTMQILFPNATY